jgi:Na+/phosphate symporter
MTIEGWNVFLDATILVLMVGYGFWLKHITTQQDRLKNNTVESLNAVIASKEAEIARLKGETAPELAKSYKAMKDHSEEMTRRVNELDDEMRALQAKIGEKEVQLSVPYIVGKAEGLMEATNITTSSIKKLIRSMKDSGKYSLNPTDVLGINQELLDLFRAAHAEAVAEVQKIDAMKEDNSD